MKTKQTTLQKRQESKILDKLNHEIESLHIMGQDQLSASIDEAKLNQDQVHRLILVKGLIKGERDIIAGNTWNHAEARERLSKWLT